MLKLLLLAKSSISKAKRQTAVIFVLILLVSLMLNLWLMLSTDYKQNFDRCHDKLNAEHVSIMVAGRGEEFENFISSAIEADKRTDSYELCDALSSSIAFQYNGGKISLNGVILGKSTADSKKVGQLEFIDVGEYKSGIFLPILYKSDDIYTGSTITIDIGSQTEEYTVCGFFNSVMMGSNNCIMTEFVFTDDKYNELQNTDTATNTTLCSIRLDNPNDGENYQTTLCNAVSAEYENTGFLANYYELIAQSRYVSQSICSALICIMAFITLLISAVVIISNISNYIHENMKNLGALKAIGFTSGQLIGSLIVQFLSITVISAVMGTGLSYLIYPSLSDMMSAQTGIPYSVRFLPIPAVISLAILIIAIALAVILSARKLRRIEPITALRMGIKTHSFKRNHMPLEKTSVPLNLALALKNTLTNMKQNFVTAITMLVISLLAVFSCLMYENVIVDMTPMLNMVVGEYADGAVFISTEIEDEFLKTMKEDMRVENTYYYTNVFVSHNGTLLIANIYDNYEKLNNQSVVYEGRFPKYDNEVAINGSYAAAEGFEIGDEITLCVSDNEEKYIITGFDINTNNLGKDCLMTRQGYEKLTAVNGACYYINVMNSDDIETLLSDISGKFGSNVHHTVNQNDMIASSAGVYVLLITIIVAAVILLSVLIITFVLYLLVKTLLNNKKKDYGIMKSLGFTTGQIVMQTALSFMPSIVISTAVGIAVSCFAINPLMELFLSGIGIVKCTFEVPYLLSAVAGAIIVVISFLTACLLSRRVRKIAPRELLINE